VIRVVVADDQPLIRAGIKLLLDHEPDLAVVGEATDGREAIALVRAERPDVALIDIRMPILDGLSATAAITADPDLADVHVVVLTTFGLDEYVYGALKAGAAGFLLKDTDPEQLLRAVRLVAAGEALIDPAVTRAVIARFTDGSGSEPSGPTTREAVAPERLDVLTARETEVLALVAAGRSNAEIGEDLFISPATARTHVGRLLSKLAARDRAQLVMIAFETGLVSPGSST
jgi:DNA-binding NarL/FixJ family response regulator